MSNEKQELCMGCMQKKANSPICPYCGYDDSKPSDLDYVMQGTLLNDSRYTIGKLLHSNGEGATYIGYDNKKKQIVWIKEYFPTKIATRNTQTLRIEAKSGHGAQYKALMSDFVELADDVKKYANHQPIIKVLNTVGENNTIYVVLEYIEALTLDEYLTANGGKLESDKALELLVPLFNCVDNIHANGIIHRGISPFTVLVGDDKKIYLSEFLLTAARTGSSELKAELYSGYSAPEQYLSTGRQGTWSDVYALGALLYRTISGVSPTKSIRINNENPLASLLEIDPSISKQISNAVKDAMNASVEKRTQTVGVFLSNIYIETNGDKTEIFDSGRISVIMPGQSDFDEIEDFDRIKPLQPDEEFVNDFDYDSDFTNMTISQAVPGMKNCNEDNNDNEDFDFSYDLNDDSGNKSSGKTKKIIVPLLIVIALVVGVLTAVLISGKLGLGKKEPKAPLVLEDPPAIAEKTDVAAQEEKDKLEKAEDEVQSVPDLVGKQWTKVEHNKDYTDIFELEMEEEYSEDIPEGVIIEQKPRANRRIPGGSKITVTVSKGYVETEMPDLLGKEEEEVKQELLKLAEGLNVEDEEIDIFIKRVYSDEVEEGLVIATKPVAGEKFNPFDTKIEIEIAKKLQTSQSTNPAQNTKPPTGTRPSTGTKPTNGTKPNGGTNTNKPGGVDSDNGNVDNLPRA